MPQDGYYDLSREASTVASPTALKLDVGRLCDLMVKANEMAATIRAGLSGDGNSKETKELARFNIALLDLVSAAVEEGIMPMASPTAATASFASVPTAPSVPSRPRGRVGSRLQPSYPFTTKKKSYQNQLKTCEVHPEKF